MSDAESYYNNLYQSQWIMKQQIEIKDQEIERLRERLKQSVSACDHNRAESHDWEKQCIAQAKEIGKLMVLDNKRYGEKR